MTETMTAAKPDLGPVHILDQAIPRDLFDRVTAEVCAMPMKYGWHSSKKVPLTHWNTAIVKRSKKDRSPIDPAALPPATRELWATLSRYVPENPNLVRCYSNGYTYGTDGWVHRDAKYAGDKTIIVYLNNAWQPNWAGETVWFNEAGDIINAALPKPARIAIFDSRRYHAARAVSRLCPELRRVLVYKARTADSENTDGEDDE